MLTYLEAIMYDKADLLLKYKVSTFPGFISSMTILVKAPLFFINGILEKLSFSYL